jgi:hypothetical protein
VTANIVLGGIDMSDNKRPTSSNDVSGPQPAAKRPRESKRDTPDTPLLDRALSGHQSANVRIFPGIDVRRSATLQQSLIPLCASEALSQFGSTHDFFCVGVPFDPAQHDAQDSFHQLPLMQFTARSSTGGGDTCNVAPSGKSVVKPQVLKYDVRGTFIRTDVRVHMRVLMHVAASLAAAGQLMCARAPVRHLCLQGTARDVSMKVHVDPAVHGRLLQLPVTRVSQDAAEVDAVLKDMQTSGGRRQGRTINTVLQLEIGAPTAELLTQPLFIRLATK